jgi:glycosidase
MEVALDFALQCSPDHPWVAKHPEWFHRRADGTIAYAENPPKKYQDIYPMAFDADFPGIVRETERLLRFWMSHGVRIFRVDNPHTKPVVFWEKVIGDINRTDPDVIFLAEAFTRPAMMNTLGMIGFQQSYTYFTWRNGKQELTDYLTELSGDAAAWMRPNFFVNTPDILHAYLQDGGRPAFAVRAVLAATLSPTWGVYAATSCARTPRCAPAARSTWTRRSTSCARATGRRRSVPERRSPRSSPGSTGSNAPSSTRCWSGPSTTPTATASATSRADRAKLDYLQWLGVDCLWLPPFYASPLRDGGYDIATTTRCCPSSAPSTTSSSCSTRRTSAASGSSPTWS